MLILILVIFFICWLPLQLMVVFLEYGEKVIWLFFIKNFLLISSYIFIKFSNFSSFHPGGLI